MTIDRNDIAGRFARLPSDKQQLFLEAL